jgi:hypothetical protein
MEIYRTPDSNMGEMMAKRLKKLPEENYWSFRIGWANNFAVNVCITPDINKSRHHRDPILGAFEKRVDQNFAGLFCATGCDGYLFLPPVFDPDTVAHETYHLIDYMMDRLGVQEPRDGEIMAYHLGYVVGKISEVYLKVKAEEKKLLTEPEKQDTL